MRVRILDEAQQDLLRGYTFYERQGEGLGTYFLDSLFSDIDSLQLHAGAHAIVYGSHRMVAKRFPYAIYYKTENSVAIVLRVLDGRKNPRWIRKQLH